MDPISITITYISPLLFINLIIATIETKFIHLHPEGKKAVKILAFVPVLNIVIAFWLFIIVLEHMI